MNFGQTFGKLIKAKRGIEGLTQQQLAARAFGDETRKTRISELENGHVAKPHQRIVDALVVALGITDVELTAALNATPHPSFVDNLVDYVELEGRVTLHAEIAIHEDGRAVFFHDAHFKVGLLRFEYFVDDRILICVTEDQSRRGFGFPLDQSVATHLVDCSEILLAYIPEQGEPIAGDVIDLKVIR